MPESAVHGLDLCGEGLSRKVFGIARDRPVMCFEFPVDTSHPPLDRVDRPIALELDP